MLDGLVNLGQFIETKNPFHLSQFVFSHGFIRGVGFSMPAGNPGPELIIPVFRSDRTFSCVIVKIGHQAGVIEEAFEDIRLNLRSEGAFEDVPGAEFAKIAICLNEDDQSKEIYDQTLYLRGLQSFNHLFGLGSWHNEYIIKYLRRIISGNRDFTNQLAIDFPVSCTPSQSSRQGLKTLLDVSLPMTSPDYLALRDPQYATAHRQLAVEALKKASSIGLESDSVREDGDEKSTAC